jgi:histone H3/H4
MRKIMQLKRVTVDAKDIQLITGCSIRSAQRLISRIRKKYGKQRKHRITVYELCEHEKLPLDEIITQLNLQHSRHPK